MKAAALVDLDNDGDKDFILSRFIDDKSEDLLLYLNDGTGKFEEQPQAITKDLDYDRAMPLTVADFNNDAKLVPICRSLARETLLTWMPNPIV